MADPIPTHLATAAAPASAAAAAPTAAPRRRRDCRAYGAVSLLLLVVFAYIPAYHGEWIWDDDEHIRRNTNLRTGQGLERIWTEPTSSPQYYPVTMTTFWVEYQLWGLNPAGYHVTNVLLHAVDALLLWLVLRRLGAPGAWVVAAVWGVHPVNVESVAWVTERKNVLSTCFYLLAALAYLRPGAKESDGSEDARAAELSPAPFASRGYWLSLVLFVLALGSKTVTSTWPAAVLLVLWWKRGRIGRRDILPLLPFLVIGAAMGAVTGFLERTHVGATGPDFMQTPAERVLRAATVAWFYAWKDLWPINLSFIYPRWTIAPWQGVFVAGIAAAIGCLWALRRRLGRGPLAGVLFFLGTLVPAMGFVNVYPMRFSHVADHFQYLASAGVIALVVAAGHRWLGSRSGAWAAGGVIISLAALTTARARVLADRELLWRDTLSKNPGAWMAHANLANALVRRAEAEVAAGAPDQALRDMAEAEEKFEAARRLRPDLAEPSVLLARVREMRGRYADAERLLAEAVRVEPGHVGAHFQRGRMLERLGRTGEAEAEYRRALELKPDSDVAHVTYGDLLTQAGKLTEAEGQYRHAIAAAPDSVEARVGLGTVLLKSGREAEAAMEFNHALRVDPTSAAARAGRRAAVQDRKDQPIR